MGIRDLLRTVFGRSRAETEAEATTASPETTAPAEVPRPREEAPASASTAPAAGEGDRTTGDGATGDGGRAAGGGEQRAERGGLLPEARTATETTAARPTAVQATPVEAAPAEAATVQATAPAGGEPALSLEKLESTAPGLVSLYKTAGTTLRRQGLAGRRAAVYLVLDRSGSMRRYYKDGTVQHLAEQALALSANLDDDGVVPVVFFSTDVDGTADLSLDAYAGRVEELHSGLGHMGRTNYHWAIEAVVDHYKRSGATDPAFVIFQTDGAPTSRPAAERALCEAAGLPIFWQFVGFGDPEGKGFDFLRRLDDLAVPERRPVDNTGFFHAGPDPLLLPDAELYRELMVEFPEWLEEVERAGILPRPSAD
ncbi:vWA domain-containing protein [Streptomyces sp. URMC 123]|uniref:vWA domain-containing protein n=1 Tax=Streptomyces sp. URMC 123 TaxID=3423403 RepID=UPI003F19BA74